MHTVGNVIAAFYKRSGFSPDFLGRGVKYGTYLYHEFFHALSGIDDGSVVGGAAQEIYDRVFFGRSLRRGFGPDPDAPKSDAPMDIEYFNKRTLYLFNQGLGITSTSLDEAETRVMYAILKERRESGKISESLFDKIFEKTDISDPDYPDGRRVYTLYLFQVLPKRKELLIEHDPESFTAFEAACATDPEIIDLRAKIEVAKATLEKSGGFPLSESEMMWHIANACAIKIALAEARGCEFGIEGLPIEDWMKMPAQDLGIGLNPNGSIMYGPRVVEIRDQILAGCPEGWRETPKNVLVCQGAGPRRGI